ncbi:glucose-1-phosphate cytidylyltransferase [Acaryochloris sp. IP29b_bin.137]|uniref:glucose-1-phosphate cytidylyltransferase n=1 Tax=Acaryochloris sp. IP29b_bin.137 TaxID=2969217 RepID=UPI002631189F|nr:glucose-1-phosphate cytidylyltransferase [Acaryochloris sp. IP29b_bin.137]
MKIIILCGGFGTRIRDVADEIPKPMIPIGGKPIIWHIMKYYAHWGYQDFILCLGYKGESIKHFFLNYESSISDLTLTLGKYDNVEYHNEHAEVGWKVTLAETGIGTLTGTRVKRVKRYLGDDDNFMLTYGDGVGNVDIKALVKFHKSHGKIMTVSGMRPPGRFGELELREDNTIVGFNEKPQATRGRISGGYFVCRKELFDYIDDNGNITLEQEPMKNLANDSQMMMYEHDGFWQPMDTYRDYKLLNSLVDDKQAPWMVWL